MASAIPQLSTVSSQFRYFLFPFPQLKVVLKICFYRNKKILPKNPGCKKYDIKLLHGQKYADNSRNEALKYGLEVVTSEKIAIAELQSYACGATFL
jgi:hypothetical protein